MMARPPFDPERAEGDLFSHEKPDPGRREKKKRAKLEGAEHLTVSQVSELIKSKLEEGIPSPIRVIGEVSNLSARNHWYFSLKDENAVISCVVWASAAKKFGFQPADGDEVVATGHISHYMPQGRTQLYVSRLDPVGAGALELRYRQMCEELRAQGYFDEDHKIPLPTFPRRIAIITSLKGAAVQDVIATAAQRCKAVGLLLVDVRVQGEGAAEDIAAAIRRIDRDRKKLNVDAILVTRGGGSIEDLWAFNERVLAEAVFDCELPLVAAIGHESDTTVIELVADMRAATPTQAAMRMIPSADELHAQIDHFDDRLDFLSQRFLERCRERLMIIERVEAFRAPELMLEAAWVRLDRLQHDLIRESDARLARERLRLESLSGRWMRLHPKEIVSQRHSRLAVLEDRLNRVSWGQILRLRKSIDSLDRELTVVDPRHVLRRGYSYTTDHKGQLIRKVSEARPGLHIITNLSDGTIDSVVGGSSPRKWRKTTGRSSDSLDQMDLFALEE